MSFLDDIHQTRLDADAVAAQLPAAVNNLAALGAKIDAVTAHGDANATVVAVKLDAIGTKLDAIVTALTGIGANLQKITNVLIPDVVGIAVDPGTPTTH